MSTNPVALKIAEPYVRTFYDLSLEQDLLYKVTTDFQNLEIFFNKTPDLVKYLINPIINSHNKLEILEKTLKSQVQKETILFLSFLVKRNRINLIETIIYRFLQLVYRLAKIKLITVSAAFPFTIGQRNTLIKKINKLTNTKEINLVFNVDSTLIGGFLIKTNSKIVDFTIKNQFKKLANHLDSVLEI